MAVISINTGRRNNKNRKNVFIKNAGIALGLVICLFVSLYIGLKIKEPAIQKYGSYKQPEFRIEPINNSSVKSINVLFSFFAEKIIRK